MRPIRHTRVQMIACLALVGPHVPASSTPARSEQPNWRCRKCGAGFVSHDGKIVGGQCPTNIPTCPLEPV